MFNSLCDKPIAQRHKRQEKQEQTAGLVVKEPTDEQQIYIAQMESSFLLSCPAIPYYERKQRIHDRKERPEIELSEQ